MVKDILWLINSGQCFFYNRLGIYCPGCGVTRAVFALLDAKVIHSILYNPIVLYACFSIFFFKERIFLKYLYCGLAILLINWVVKNLFLYNGIDILLIIDTIC